MALNIYARYKTNAALEDDGAWVDYGAGLKFKMRRYSAKKSLDVKTALEKPYRGRNMQSDLPSEVAEKLAIEHLAKGVLVDWDGVFGTDGAAIAFNVENATKLLTDLPDLAKSLIFDAINADNFKDAEKKDTAGN